MSKIEGSLSKHMQVQKDTVSSSAEKDITIMRLQSDVKQAQEKLEELQRDAEEVRRWNIKQH